MSTVSIASQLPPAQVKEKRLKEVEAQDEEKKRILADFKNDREKKHGLAAASVACDASDMTIDGGFEESKGGRY